MSGALKGFAIFAGLMIVIGAAYAVFVLQMGPGRLLVPGDELDLSHRGGVLVQLGLDEEEFHSHQKNSQLSIGGALDESTTALQRRLAELRVVHSVERKADLLELKIAEEINPVALLNLLCPVGRMSVHLVDDQTDMRTFKLGERRRSRVKLADYSNPHVEYLVEEKSILTNEHVKSASQGFDETGRAQINFSLTPAGGSIFGDFTTQYIGRAFAIAIDDQVMSSANVRTPILGGEGRITGSFTIEEAQYLAMMMRNPPLPVPLSLEKLQRIAPDQTFNLLNDDMIAKCS